MERLEHPDKTLVAIAIAAPHAADGAGSALRRAFPVPGAAPPEMLRLLKEIDERVSRSVVG